jgi:putative oxidoreductase
MNALPFRRLFTADAPRPVVLIRVLVGWVFLSEGIQKFLFPASVGAGRFAKIGIPAPEVMGPFVGCVEIVCGALILMGLATRLAAGALLFDMVVALVSTKVPILLGHGFWGFAAPKAEPGLWSMLHESRTDLSMVLGALFLVVIGSDPASLDARLARRHGTADRPAR